MYVKCEDCKKYLNCDYLKKNGIEANNCDEYEEVNNDEQDTKNLATYPVYCAFRTHYMAP